MASWYDFAVAQFATNGMRCEKLNVGIVVIGDDLDVRAGRNLDKVRAISHAISGASIREALNDVAQLDKSLKTPSDGTQARLARAAALVGLDFSAVGRFEASSTEAYENYVQHLLSTLIEPEPAARKKQPARSKLVAALRQELRNRRVLAREGEDISSHRLVSNWKIEEGLTADFALQNGSLHIIKAVDASSDSTRLRRVVQDVAVSSLVLETARASFGRENVKGKIVYSASSHNEALAKPSLETAAYQGAELVNWASADDRRKFVDHISDLANPLPLVEWRDTKEINASTTERFKLN